MTRTLNLAQPLINALRILGHNVLVDEAEHDLQSTWLDVGPLSVQVHPDNGYGLYLVGDLAYGTKPDETYSTDQVNSLRERMQILLATA